MSGGNARDPRPSYLTLLETGELPLRVNALYELLRSCSLCPSACAVDRRAELGRCATTDLPVVASWGPHHGEEPPISGTRGSGTVFLANCNLRCVFCQNADISQRPRDFIGHASSLDELAEVMLGLQADGCHNVNWVSPTHQAPQLVGALAIAAARGLRVPIVYNTNAYDSVAVLRLLDGIVDVYMPDLKYSDDDHGRLCSRAPDYPAVARAAIAEMFRQVGDGWDLDGEGALRRGLLVRLLILPRRLAGIEESLRWLAEALSPAVTVSLMCQYRPHHFAARPGRYPELARTITPSEYAEAAMALSRWNRSQHTLVQPYLGRRRADED
ncbi:MAG: radical SAM protein [Acidobacteriota bacterium]